MNIRSLTMLSVILLFLLSACSGGNDDLSGDSGSTSDNTAVFDTSTFDSTAVYGN